MYLQVKIIRQTKSSTFIESDSSDSVQGLTVKPNFVVITEGSMTMTKLSDGLCTYMKRVREHVLILREK